jgi:phospholipid/cholesterol/gamma-HCH transport system substrate-binding protein
MSAVTVLILVSACGPWRGAAGVPLPGGPGTGPRHLTITIQIPDTLALNVNSRVRVADVYVGRVRAVALNNWVATLTVDLEPDVRLPSNAVAAIGQTSLLGTQHLELASPPVPSSEPLGDGDTIPLSHSSAFPDTEDTLASIAPILAGGGVTDLQIIQSELHNVFAGRAEQIRGFLRRLDTFTAELNRQRKHITRAIDSTSELLSIAAAWIDTIDRVLTEIPPLITYLAASREKIADAVDALGRISRAADSTLAAARQDLRDNLTASRRPLRELARAAPLLVETLRFLVTSPFPIDNIGKVVRGDYINASIVLDATLSALDNGFLSGTGLSGSLRALEQAWGRDPQEMIPDVRFTPNPHSAPGGPLVERSE